MWQNGDVNTLVDRVRFDAKKYGISDQLDLLRTATSYEFAFLFYQVENETRLVAYSSDIILEFDPVVRHDDGFMNFIREPSFCENAANHPLFSNLPGVNEYPYLGQIIGKPLVLENRKEFFSLVLANSESKQHNLDETRIYASMDRFFDGFSNQLERLSQRHAKPQPVCSPASVGSEKFDLISKMPTPVAIVRADGEMIVCSQGFNSRTEISQSFPDGAETTTNHAKLVEDALPKILKHYQKRTISIPNQFETKICETLEHGQLILRAFPIEIASPPEKRSYFVSIENAPLPLGFHESSAQAPVNFDGNNSFLLDTLIKQRQMHSRNGVSYLAVRKWRKQMKSYQIQSMKRTKANPCEKIVRTAAEEILLEAKSVFGSLNFDTIVSVPPGHSGMVSFSTLLGKAASEITMKPHVQAFQPIEVKGKSSHPKTNATRGKMKLMERPEGNILLVDDVATSGRHLEEASKLLRSENNFVLPVAWIGPG